MFNSIKYFALENKIKLKMKKFLIFYINFTLINWNIFDWIEKKNKLDITIEYSYAAIEILRLKLLSIRISG